MIITLLTCKHLNDHRHLLLNDIPIREASITAVISSRVINQHIREIQISIDSHGNPAVLPYRLHGGESCLNGPVERSRIGTWHWTEPISEINSNRRFHNNQIPAYVYLYFTPDFSYPVCCCVEGTHNWTSSRSQVLAGLAEGHRTGPEADQHWLPQVPESPAATQELLHKQK